MLQNLEMRNFVYSTVTSILACIFVIIVNFSRIKTKKNIAGQTSRIIANEFFLLSEKIKLFKPFSYLTFWAIIEIILISVLQMYSVGLLAKGFARIVNTTANFFGYSYFLPILLCVLFMLIWANPLKNMDFFALVIPTTLGVNKIGCFAAGCCNSVWWPGGMYNYARSREEIPIQLIESACAFLIFVVLIVYTKKAKNRKDGDLYPLFCILYGSTRFISEFWRGDLLVWGPFKYYHLFCFISIVLGVVYLYIVRKYGDKITLYFDSTLYFSKKLKQKQIDREALKS